MVRFFCFHATLFLVESISYISIDSLQEWENMRKTRILLIAQTVLLCLFVSMASAGMSSESFRIVTSVMSSGGNTMSSDNFSMVSTLGQSSPQGNAASDNFNIDAGFWYTLLLSIVGDVNGDGAVDLKDMISVLQVMTGQTVDSIVKEADANGDDRIGLEEAVIILRETGGF